MVGSDVDISTASIRKVLTRKLLELETGTNLENYEGILRAIWRLDKRIKSLEEPAIPRKIFVKIIIRHPQLKTKFSKKQIKLLLLLASGKIILTKELIEKMKNPRKEYKNNGGQNIRRHVCDTRKKFKQNNLEKVFIIKHGTLKGQQGYFLQIDTSYVKIRLKPDSKPHT